MDVLESRVILLRKINFDFVYPTMFRLGKIYNFITIGNYIILYSKKFILCEF